MTYEIVIGGPKGGVHGLYRVGSAGACCPLVDKARGEHSQPKTYYQLVCLLRLRHKSMASDMQSALAAALEVVLQGIGISTLDDLARRVVDHGDEIAAYITSSGCRRAGLVAAQERERGYRYGRGYRRGIGVGE